MKEEELPASERQSADAAHEGNGETYPCTFGHYLQKSWFDVRHLTWADLCSLMTHHEIGEKEGTCIVPATFSGTRRHQKDTRQISVAVLDCDTGATLEQIRSGIARQGWRAIVASTHSHGTTCHITSRKAWDAFCAGHPACGSTATQFLLAKGYAPHVAEGAEVVEEGSEMVVLRHSPCPKFRIVIPLLRPWKASDYATQAQANAAWKAFTASLASCLGVAHDQACSDTSRLFYLPRHPGDGAPPETAILDGDPCDLSGLAAAPIKKPNPAPGSRHATKGTSAAIGSPRGSFVDSDTGEITDLTDWARRNAHRFEIEKALRARRPELVLGRVTDGIKHHIRCVNADQHTRSDPDAATMIINASDSTNQGWVYHCRHAHCDGQDRLFFLTRMLEQRWLTTADLWNPEFLSTGCTNRRTIRYVAGELPDVVDQAEQALLAAELNIYQRGTLLVRPAAIHIGTGRPNDVAAHRIVEVGERALVEAMTLAADWRKYDKRTRGWCPIDAPLPVAKTYQQRVGQWKLLVLSGLIDAPTLRSDGSILETRGYDRDTGLLLMAGATNFPRIPVHPDRVAARAALDVLVGLIETFPFVTPGDRAVALSAILTACIRRSIATAPLHAFSAPVMGSGKSKLVDIASLIANGHEAAVIAQGKTEEELEKRLGALLMSGEAVVPIDNCEAPLGGEFLCQILTQPVVRARILGRSEVPELPSNALVTATGNNLVLVGDMARRTILCRLDPQCERPELRKFDNDPVEQVKTNRARYLAAALTVLRAYHVAGRPQQRDPLGSFSEWSRWVRDALIWLDEADPVETQEEVRAQDPRLETLKAVLVQWRQVIGLDRVSSQDIIARTEQTQAPPAGSTHGAHTSTISLFRQALMAVAGGSDGLNSRRLSKWIASSENRIVDGLSIERRPMLNGFLTWRLKDEAERSSQDDPVPVA